MSRRLYSRRHVEPRPRVQEPDKFATALHSAGYSYRSLATELDIPKSTLHRIAMGQLAVAPAFAAQVEEALSVAAGSLFAATVSTTPDAAPSDPTTPSNPSPGQG